MASGRAAVTASAAVAERLARIPAAREVVPSDPGLSARWHMHSVPSPFSRWNRHPEYEIHLIRSGTGRFIVGDRIDVFSAGQLVLVGSNLPHHWISDLEPGQIITDRDVVFQFSPRMDPPVPNRATELQAINALLKRSARTSNSPGRPRAGRPGRCSPSARRPGQNGCNKSSASSMCSSPRPTPSTTLAKAWLPPLDDQYAAGIIDRAFSYVFDNLVGDLRLSAAADMIGMSDSAFSRYFKRMSGQTFGDTVRKLHLAQACQLLNDTDLPLGSIYRRVGYANLSNFNRQFRAQYSITPREFRRHRRP